MHPVIEKFYETETVVGQSGKVCPFWAAIEGIEFADMPGMTVLSQIVPDRPKIGYAPGGTAAKCEDLCEGPGD